MTKKINLLAVHQSASPSSQLPENLRTPKFLAPAIVRAMGNLAGAAAENMLDGGDDDRLAELTRAAYFELSDTTATLLDLLQISEVSDEAIASVSHRLAAAVDPLVSLHSRVDHLYRSFLQGEEDHFIADVQKLWAALELRCDAVTGLGFEALLSYYADAA